MIAEAEYEWFSWRGRGAGAIALCLGVSLAGCANPGIPKPPSLRLPATVTDLTGSRIGDRVELRWTAPSRTSDKLELTGPTTVEICRDPAPEAASERGHAGPAHAAAEAATVPCTTVFSEGGHAGSSTAVVGMPPELTRDGVQQVVAFRVRVLNSAGRSAPASAPVLVAGGPAPVPVAGFRAEQQKAGVLLQWQKVGGEAGSRGGATHVEVLRVMQQAPGAQPKQTPAPTGRRPRSRRPGAAATRARENDQSGIVRLQPDQGEDVSVRSMSAERAGALEGMVDEAAVDQQTYTYSAQRVLTVPGAGGPLQVLSEPTAAITVAVRDTFAPDAPRGLVSVPGEAKGNGAGRSIDLAWEPNTEVDLLGYVVYRTDVGGGQGRPERLTGAPIAGTAYRDASAVAGRRYSYRVTAVDQHGNESAPSASVEDTLDGR